MAKTTLLLEYILNMANNFEFDSDDVYISRKIFEHYLEIPSYSLNEFLDILKISKTRLKKYFQQLGYQKYTEFKDEIRFEKIIRVKQIMTHYRNFNINETINIMEQLKNPRRDVDILVIDKICTEIHQHDRMIFYGSPSLLNLIYVFQVDMKIFGKTVLLSSVNNDKIISPHQNDMIAICSATGRLFGCCDSQFQEKVLNSQHMKILFTQKIMKREDVNYTIAMDTANDYYEMHYLFLFYFDLIKTRYYELYIRGK